MTDLASGAGGGITGNRTRFIGLRGRCVTFYALIPWCCEPTLVIEGGASTTSFARFGVWGGAPARSPFLLVVSGVVVRGTPRTPVGDNQQKGG